MLAAAAVTVLVLVHHPGTASAQVHEGETYEDQDGTVVEVYFAPLEGPPGTVISITGRCLWEGQPAEAVDITLRVADRQVVDYVAHTTVPVGPDRQRERPDPDTA